MSVKLFLEEMETPQLRREKDTILGETEGTDLWTNSNRPLALGQFRSVGLIVVGAFIAGARDLSFDGHGYLLVLGSNLTTAVYLTTISRLGKSTGLNSFGLMWCNGIICGPILLLWTMVSGELATALRFPAVFLPGFQLVILLSCMMAFCLNYTIFLNTSLNSPLTQTMCGNIKDLGTILLGWIWFGGLPFDWLNVLGQFLGYMGSGLYAYCKLRGI